MFFHSQDIRGDSLGKKELLHWRCWWHFNESKTVLALEILIPSHFWHFHIDLATGENAFELSIATPLCALWFHVDNHTLEQFISRFTARKDRSYNTGRQVGVSFHDGTFYFSIWEDPDEWRTRDPKWWRFTFNPMDFFFGRAAYSKDVLQEGGLIIDMPEGVYEATYTRFVSYWKRPRLPFVTKIHRITIDVPAGIPHEGKGENSWDMGMDATFSSTFPVGENEDLYAIKNRFAIDALKKRQKYGSLSQKEYLEWKIKREEKLMQALHTDNTDE